MIAPSEFPPSIAKAGDRPIVDRTGITVELCLPDGALASPRIRKRDREVFRQLKRKKWGDEVDPNLTWS
jgi:ribosomal protein RSM22 (predicted rRNA methylase)